jgi:UDP-N-acetylmuramoylalanine--D-glutamate ligase
VREALNRGTPVYSELEIGYLLKNPDVHIAAVTGTNGKTTTTSLLAEMFTAAGLVSAAAGNIGVPLVTVAQELTEGWIACEVSSFQLETIKEFRPEVAGIINITPDHLDRHHDMAEYSRIKARIAENQEAGDWLILNYDDPLVRGMADGAGSQVVFFSVEGPVRGGVYAENGMIISDYLGIGEIMPVTSTRLRG